jgi:EAL domain-containing protein (putative c-di-GMP-specific phosphodiesterase class I)
MSVGVPASVDSAQELLDGLAATHELERILEEGLVRSVYQPIADLDSGALVGYEALARGPEGSALERPDRLFAAAAVAGRTFELDWACRAAALKGALAGDLQQPLSLFINVEPSTLQAEMPAEITKLLETARTRFRVVIELTERGLTERPAEVLASCGDYARLAARSRSTTWASTPARWRSCPSFDPRSSSST